MGGISIKSAVAIKFTLKTAISQDVQMVRFGEYNILRSILILYCYKRNIVNILTFIGCINFWNEKTTNIHCIIRILILIWGVKTMNDKHQFGLLDRYIKPKIPWMTKLNIFSFFHIHPVSGYIADIQLWYWPLLCAAHMARRGTSFV